MRILHSNGSLIVRCRLFCFAYVLGRGVPFVCLQVGRKVFHLDRVIIPFLKLWEFTRSLFPMFYAIGLRDCDTGGRVFAWYADWGLNLWHAQGAMLGLTSHALKAFFKRDIVVSWEEACELFEGQT